MMTRALLLFIALTGTLAATAADDVLRPEEAFRYSVETDGDRLIVDWDIEEGYYLYKHKIGFETDTPGITLGEPTLPRGKEKEDEFFGKSEVYRVAARMSIPFTRANDVDSLQLTVKSQGCADMGLCYPPQRWSSDVALPVVAASAPAAGDDTASALFGDLAGGADFGVGGGEFLHPDDAFRFFAEMADDYTVRVQWDIADGYYLYREKFGFEGASELVKLARPALPRGKEKHDEFFGDVEVYYNSVDIRIPVSRASPAPGELALTLQFQGCAEDGICYPPQSRDTLIGISAASTDAPATRPAIAADTPVAEQDKLAGFIASSSLPLVLLSFFALGIGLAFTPCVLPMVPILSGIIIGQGKDVTTRESLKLSLVYVIAMALTYAAAGVTVALLGKNVQAMFQNPVIIVAFAALFVALALAMFDVYEFQMPAAIQTRLTSLSNSQQGGNTLGVGIMGVLSALIVGPCVAAPLVGALIFIGQTGDAVRGGLTLFALGLGMGAPLIAFGASAGKLAARAGTWMTTVKYLFGLLFIGLAIWMLSRIVPPRVIMVLWAGLAVATAWVLGAFRSKPGAAGLAVRSLGIVALGYGAVLGASAAVGGSDPLNPLRGTPWHHEVHLEFERIKTVDDLDRAIARASEQGRPVMLDFYADWCVSCKEMEKYTFTDPTVHSALSNAVLLQADVTANDDADQAMLNRFGIYGPPTIAFFDARGEEIGGTRVVGFWKADKFSAHVERALAQ